MPSNASGDVYRHALSVGITKRNDGLIAIPNRESDLIPAYEANLPTIAEYQASYETMLGYTDIIPGGYMKWTPERFKNAIETAHLTMLALDQASDCGYKIYTEQREVLEKAVNRMGYNFTVTAASRRNRHLEVTVKNTGLAPAFFDMTLCAEITDADGNRLEGFGEPILIKKGTFTDGSERTFTFAYNGIKLPNDAVICLALYEGSNTGSPSVRFDNKGSLPNKRLKLDPTDAFAKLTGTDCDTAISKGYISRSEYNRQITGSVKALIEGRMGRKLDNSRDRFFLVRNKELGIAGDAKYLYCSSTMDVYPVAAETVQNRAVWYWKGTKAAEYGLDDDPEKQSQFLDAMEFYGITEIYYSIGANKLVKDRETVSKFVKNAYARGMRVYLLTGENTWLYEDSYDTSIYRVFDKVEEYNSLAEPESRIAGVSYDAEVWTNAEFDWKNSPSARAQQARYIAEAQSYADSKGLSVSFCLPFWLVRYDFTDAQGNTRNLYDVLTQTARKTIIMAYRDTVPAIEKLITDVQSGAELSIAQYNEKNGCILEIAVQVDENKEGDFVSFFEEESRQSGYVLEALEELRADLDAYTDRITFALHHAVTMYEYYLSLAK